MVTERRAPAARAPREEGKEAAIVPPQPGTVYDIFQEVFPHLELVATQGVADVIITVPRDAIHNVLNGAREEPRLQFDYLRSLCGVDEVARSGDIEIVYHLYSFANKHNVTVKCPVPLDDPRIPTVTDIWVGADWHERETYEMFGVRFDGHPHLVPLLLEEGLNIHPLRKDHPLAEVEIKQGLDVIAFKERFNWGGAAVGEEVVTAADGATTSAPGGAAGAAKAPSEPRRKLTPEEMEAAKERAAQLRAEHQAKKAAGEVSGERKKRFTPEEIAAIKARAGQSATPAAAPTAAAPAEDIVAEAPETAEAAAPAAEAEAPAEEAAAVAPAAAAPRRKLTEEEIEEVKRRAAEMRAEHQAKKAAGEVSGERKKRYTPEEIEAIKQQAKGGG
ncbi:MAG: NADH-quinone oxidoreductase subunit C [Dehalococcoidia bacterium]